MCVCVCVCVYVWERKRECIYLFIFIYIVKLETFVDGDPKVPFFRGVEEGATSFPCLWSLPYNAACKTRQHPVLFLSLWYNSPWDWTVVFRTTGEHSTH